MLPLEKTQRILDRCLMELRKKSPDVVRKYQGTAVEGYLAMVMRSVIAQEFAFNGIEVREISGQKLTDIVLQFALNY